MLNYRLHIIAIIISIIKSFQRTNLLLTIRTFKNLNWYVIKFRHVAINWGVSLLWVWEWWILSSSRWLVRQSQTGLLVTVLIRLTHWKMWVKHEQHRQRILFKKRRESMVIDHRWGYWLKYWTLIIVSSHDEEIGFFC